MLAFYIYKTTRRVLSNFQVAIVIAYLIYQEIFEKKLICGQTNKVLFIFKTLSSEYECKVERLENTNADLLQLCGQQERLIDKLSSEEKKNGVSANEKHERIVAALNEKIGKLEKEVVDNKKFYTEINDQHMDEINRLQNEYNQEQHFKRKLGTFLIENYPQQSTSEQAAKIFKSDLKTLRDELIGCEATTTTPTTTNFTTSKKSESITRTFSTDSSNECSSTSGTLSSVNLKNEPEPTAYKQQSFDNYRDYDANNSNYSNNNYSNNSYNSNHSDQRYVTNSSLHKRISTAPTFNKRYYPSSNYKSSYQKPRGFRFKKNY